MRRILELTEAGGASCLDFNCSGSVKLKDFAAFASCMGLPSPNIGCPQAVWECADLNNNGVVDLVDFATFALFFGT